MAERRRYDARTKAKAVGIALVDGVTKAGEVTGIPKTTIDYWLDKPEFVQLRTTARDAVIQQLWVGLQVGVEVLTSGLRGDAPLNHKAAAFDSLAERYALLSGDVTSRSETKAITAGLDDHEKEALRAVLDQILEPALTVEDIERRLDP